MWRQSGGKRAGPEPAVYQETPQKRLQDKLRGKLTGHEAHNPVSFRGERDRFEKRRRNGRAQETRKILGNGKEGLRRPTGRGGLKGD